MTVVLGRFKGRKSPRQILMSALEAADDLDLVVVVCRYKPGDDEKDPLIVTGWSAGGTAERLGLLELGKVKMIDAERD